MSRNLIKLVLVTFVFCLTTGICAQQNPPESYAYKKRSNFKSKDCSISLKLSLPKKELVLNELYEFSYALKILNGNCKLYNPSFNSLIPEAGQLALYDSKKKYLLNLTKVHMGSRRSPGKYDWVNLRDKNCSKFTVQFRPGTIYHDKLWQRVKSDKTYFVQLIYYESLLIKQDFASDYELRKKHFYSNYNRKELFRSNKIKIEIVEKN